MALNCPERSPEGEPCGTCESCSRIWGGHTALDVVEIDAASNRGVDDARDLRERAMYAPSEEGRYKVYIVDEAHMLTREAWNALLKILEEPPPRVIFVFATTEPQKIQQSAAPILSRCQRFDFRRIGVSEIVLRLQKVLEREGLGAPEEALRIIARKADGGMRDALSILDQVLSLTGGEVDAEAVRRVLGLVEEERYLELLDILAEGGHGEVFGLVERLMDEGYDLVEFYHGLMDVLRVALRMRLSPGTPVDLRADLRAEFERRAQRFAPGDLVRMLSAAAELEANGSLRRSASPRVIIEMLLLRLSYLDRTVDLEELLRALGGAPAPTGGAGVPPAGAARETEAAVLEPDPGKPHSGGRPTVAPAETLQDAWVRWLGEGVGVPRGLSPLLRSATLRELEGGRVELALAPGPIHERLSEPGVLAAISEGLAPHVGRRVEFVVVEEGHGPSEATQRIGHGEVRRDTLQELVRKEPRLQRAVEELDLELMD